MRFKLFIILLFYNLCAYSQNEQIIKTLTENLAYNIPEDFDMSELVEKLNFYQKRPINLNHTSPEELKNLIFLNPLQISNFFTHIAENGELNDLFELQSIDGFDLATIQKMLPFVSLYHNNEYRNFDFKNSSNDLLIRYGQTLETQKGFTDLAGNRYLGGPEKMLLKYKYNYNNIISSSIILDKDAGETFLNHNKLNFISASLAFYKLNRFKKVIVGDYALQFGQGLTLWSGFSFNKGADITTIAKKDVGLKPYTSANEYSFFRGLATTVNLFKNIDLTSFVSYRNLDANLNYSNNEATLSSINQTGLYRTESEITNQNSLNQKIYGGVVQYNKNYLSIGLIGYHSQYSAKFEPSSEPYKQHTFSGNKLTNLGLHYNYTFQNIYFFGEIAQSSSNGWAYVNGALMSLSPTLSSGFLHRNYAKNYHNFFNQAFAESTDPFNENGFYAGLNFTPKKYLSISFYTDYFRFPWLKYRVDDSSQGHDFFGQMIYTISKKTKFLLQYRSVSKQQNTDNITKINYLEEVKNENYRFEINWQLKTINLQNQVQVTQYKKGEMSAEYAYSIYQDINYSPKNSKLSGNLRLAYFNTPSYNSRIYAYEDDVLYNFTFGMYNGKGSKGFVNLNYKLTKKIEMWTRYAVFIYRNTENIGSDLDQIIGNKKSEIRLQLRYVF